METLASAAGPSCTFASDEQRLRAFGEAIDTIKNEIEGKVGPEDLRRVRRLDAFSHAMEVVGRVLIHVSFEPLLFAVGVFALWIHKQLQATEIGHTALHGAYDRLEGAGRYHSKRHRWQTPIDEESWRYGHNVRHHQYTNVAGKDGDIHFGPTRLTDKTPYAKEHRHQLLFTLFVLFPNFGFLMNLHFTGFNDLYVGNGRPDGMDFLDDRSPATRRKVWAAMLRKYVPFYFKEYVFYPVLAGPFFWKVMLGNFLAERMRDIYSAATIYCGHVGEDVASFDEGTKAKGRGPWYAMQAAATNNYEVSLPISILCGGLDHQIEHHMFPRLAPPRLREIAPKIRAACEAHGVPYKTDSWGRTLRKAIRHIAVLSREEGYGVKGVAAVARAMA